MHGRSTKTKNTAPATTTAGTTKASWTSSATLRSLPTLTQLL